MLRSGANYHWVIYDIPASTTSLPQGVANVAEPATPAGSKQTHWSFGAQFGYGGPCPPVYGGDHEYQFTVYAFATATIPVSGGPTDPALADAVIQAEKTESGTLTGKFKR